MQIACICSLSCCTFDFHLSHYNAAHAHLHKTTSTNTHGIPILSTPTIQHLILIWQPTHCQMATRHKNCLLFLLLSDHYWCFSVIFIPGAQPAAAVSCNSFLPRNKIAITNCWHIFLALFLLFDCVFGMVFPFHPFKLGRQPATNTSTGNYWHSWFGMQWNASKKRKSMKKALRRWLKLTVALNRTVVYSLIISCVRNVAWNFHDTS